MTSAETELISCANLEDVSEENKWKRREEGWSSGSNSYSPMNRQIPYDAYIHTGSSCFMMTKICKIMPKLLLRININDRQEVSSLWMNTKWPWRETNSRENLG